MTFARTLISWYHENGRSLPWRQTRDAYAIWLSEIILQQTQVKQGWDYWLRFMQRWPTIGQLAAASEDEVLRLWQGLGYYSRARNLHTAARQVVAMGGFPDTEEGLRKLKGVGDYTAAAVASFAFHRRAAVVDGNVFRVLARCENISTPINSTEGKHLFAALAKSIVDTIAEGADIAVYNQAIMDFGATMCTPQSPRCEECPLMECCVALRCNRVGELPVKLKTTKVKERRLVYTYVRCHGFTAIRRRAAGDIWQGLYEPWLTETPPQGAVPIKKHVKHVLTHRVLYADFYLLETDERPVLPDGYLWIPEQDIDQYGVPRLIEMMLEELWKK